jgi:NTE family protein
MQRRLERAHSVMMPDDATLGLALSGGGFRATLFGLGSLWRLNDAGLLSKLRRITSVSGGSIIAGLLAQNWSRLQFVEGHAVNFVPLVAEPVLDFCDRTIDLRVGLRSLLRPFSRTSEQLAACYAERLFGATRLADLPDARLPHNPAFTFYATNLQTGVSFRFRQDMLADYVLGISRQTDVPLAVAVAASSAFPPFFSPLILRTDPAGWRDGRNLPNGERLRSTIHLTDGGVSDNMGLESLVGNVDVVLVSDAGAPLIMQASPSGDYVRQLGRVRDILIEQTRALRKRWLISEFIAGTRRGAYWGIGTRVASYPDEDSPYQDTAATAALEAIPTRLAPFSPRTRGQLVNWGYVLCEVALRTRARIALPRAASLPMPECALN